MHTLNIFIAEHGYVWLSVHRSEWNTQAKGHWEPVYSCSASWVTHNIHWGLLQKGTEEHILQEKLMSPGWKLDSKTNVPSLPQVEPFYAQHQKWGWKGSRSRWLFKHNWGIWDFSSHQRAGKGLLMRIQWDESDYLSNSNIQGGILGRKLLHSSNH